MSGISTHVLDTSSGRPAAGIKVEVFLAGEPIGSGITDTTGRVPALLAEGVILSPGTYRIRFEVRDYFPDGFYSEVAVSFSVRGMGSHYHVPLLISPYGYTTYRGS